MADRLPDSPVDPRDNRARQPRRQITGATVELLRQYGADKEAIAFAERHRTDIQHPSRWRRLLDALRALRTDR